MKKLFGLLTALFISTTASATTTLIYNINGYTIKDGQLIQFNALKLIDDTIDTVFTSPYQQPKDAKITSINGNGLTMLPGLIDAHGHILNYGLSLQRVDLTNTISELDAVDRVIAFSKHVKGKNKEPSWIQGRGWNQVNWPSKNFPSAASLDKLFPNTPIFLERIDGHAGWANSKAMQIAGITKLTVSPPGGEIIVDEQKNPTGVFVDNAMELITKKIPPLSRDQQKQTLIQAMGSLASVGLTSVHDAGVSSKHIDIYNEIAQERMMPIRVNAMLYLPSNNWQDTLKQGPIYSKDATFAFNSVKIQADGALGSRGAAMHAPYSDSPHNHGLLLHTNDKLIEYISTAMNHGFQVNTHAIGDKANSLVLDNYDALIASTQSKHLRHRIEHAQVLRLNDIPRFKSLNVIASIQATHATSDKNMAESRIGKKRLAGAYAWRSLLNAGAKLANGSDFPVEPINPFYGLHAAVTRQDRLNQPLGGWISSEKLTLVEAFKSFTIDAAYSGHQEHIIGSLEAGKKADFILLNKDIFNQPVTELWKTQVIETWVNGKRVYKRN